LAAKGAQEETLMKTDVDPYRDIAVLYLSLVSPESAQSTDLDDPVISTWIAENVPNDAKILDAGCGLGFETVALHKGSLGQNHSKRFRAYGSDFSQAMLDAAIANGAKAGLHQSRYRRASFAQLANLHDDWQDFDAVVVNYGIYTFPDSVNIENYDAYFLECCTGLASVLKRGGHLIFNTRDWGAFVNGGKHEKVHENTHNATNYRCHYSWTFNDNGHHTAILTMSSSDGKQQTTSINFAHRKPEQLIELAEKCGLAPVFRGRHGEDATAFHTIVMNKIR
jgi:ubiquinone/menaquinone biosynthesis C-methylase UbiE